MSAVLGGNGLKEVYMKMASFGSVQIAVTPKSDNPEILHVDIGAQNRKEGVSMQTNKDETVDQFCARVKSMLRSLWNGEPRVESAGTSVESSAAKKVTPTWDEQKAAIKSKAENKADAKDAVNTVNTVKA